LLDIAEYSPWVCALQFSVNPVYHFGRIVTPVAKKDISYKCVVSLRDATSTSTSVESPHIACSAWRFISELQEKTAPDRVGAGLIFGASSPNTARVFFGIHWKAEQRKRRLGLPWRLS
jgi:hypothetical protein